ncbi:unnamed protein product [Absidia cylindrospora]
MFSVPSTANPLLMIFLLPLLKSSRLQGSHHGSGSNHSSAECRHLNSNNHHNGSSTASSSSSPAPTSFPTSSNTICNPCYHCKTVTWSPQHDKECPVKQAKLARKPFVRSLHRAPVPHPADSALHTLNHSMEAIRMNAHDDSMTE